MNVDDEPNPESLGIDLDPLDRDAVAIFGGGAHRLANVIGVQLRTPQ